MDADDQEVLEQATAWLEQGEPVWLITVAATWGSSPRPAGALMAVGPQGRRVGSVSGGCLESDLLARLGPPGAGLPRRLEYRVSADDARQHGLPCGGRVELVIEGLTERAGIAPALDAMRARRRLCRELDLDSGRVHWRPAERAIAPFRCDGKRMSKLYGPAWRLLIIGDGQLPRRTAQMARALDYEVIICDPRVDRAEGWDFPDARLDTRMPDDAVAALCNDPRSAVVTLTHDPRLDDLALLEALPSEAFYVGALGSRRTDAKRRQRLAGLGISGGQLARLRGPVGLALGGRLPAEIAVSVVAEMTAVRHQSPLSTRETRAAAALAE